MKQIILLIALLSFCLAVNTAKAQMMINIVDPNESTKADSIDRVQFIVQYKLSLIPDTLKPEEVVDETMMLKVGTRSSAFYSYTKYVTDSIIREMMKKNDGKINMNSRDRNPGRISYQIYKNYPAGSVTTLDQVASNRFRCEEKNEIPQWELLPDTMKILSYSCQKAVCSFKGRDYEVWFTSEIPRSEGPWKLQGLPGLILKAEDSQKHYVFECTGIERGEAEEALLVRSAGYEPISRKNLNKIYERYVKDPIGYVQSTAPNVKIVVKNESGESITPKDTPYNPIERTI